MVKRLSLLALLLVLGANLVGCGGVLPCDAPARQSIGPCSLGGHKDGA
jgi:hypothetical protein